MSAFEARARAVIASASVSESKPAAAGEHAVEPADLAALWAVCDGLELADGTRILGRAEAAEATTWLKQDKALDWDPALLVIGEREDLVIVRDADPQGARAGGGVLEAPTDGLASFRRVARDVIGYLEARTGVAEDPAPAPERAAKAAVAKKDAAAIAAAIAHGFYPGAERDLAQAATTLGGLLARAGDDDGAMSAFARAVAARVKAPPRGAEASEAAAAWRACATVAEKAGAKAIAERCRTQAAGH